MNDDSIKKYGKKVNKNGWQARLYRWAWNKEPKFKGYCPFFHVTWITLLLSPFIFVGRFFYACGEYLSQIFEEKYQNYKTSKDDSESQVAAPYIGDAFLIKLFENEKELSDPFFKDNSEYILKSIDMDVRCYAEKYGRKVETVKRWLKQNPEWRELYPGAKLRVEAYRKRLEEQQVKEERRKEALKAKIQECRWVMKVLSWLGIGAGAYGLAKLAIIFPWVSFLQSLLTAVIIVVSAILVFALLCGIIYGIFRVVRLGFKEAFGDGTFLREVVWDGIKEGGAFLIESVKMFYTEQCPMITWTENESGPIEKRK